MRKIIVLVILIFGISDLYSQDNGEQQEDKNLELKEQSVYSEEEGKEEEKEMPQSFTLDPMSEGEKTEEINTEAEVIEVQSEPELEEKPIVEEETTVEATSESTENYNKKNEVQTLAGNNHHSGGFGALSFKGTNFNNKNIVMAGIRGGWIINRSFAIGFEGYGVIPTAEYSDIVPNFNTRAVGGYGGLFLEPIILSNKVIHVTFPVSGGAGWLGYLYDWEDVGYSQSGELIDGDVFWYIEPGASLELNVSRNFRIDLGVSYRFTQDLKLINTSSDSFDDWNYFLTLKFGSF